MKKFSKVIICLVLVLSIAVLGAFAFTACNKKTTTKIGVQAGTTGELYVKTLENVTTTPYTTGTEAVMDLVNGNIKYVVIDSLTATALQNQFADKTKVIDIPLSAEEYGYGVNKSKTELLTNLNAWLAANATTVQTIINNYTADPAVIKTYSAGTKDPSKTNQIVIATSADFPPFEYMDGEKFTGIDIEIMETFAAAYGYEVVISNMDFDSVVLSVNQGLADIAASGLTITEERKQTVNFSTPYYTDSYQVVICLKDDTTFDGCTTTEQVEKILQGK